MSLIARLFGSPRPEAQHSQMASRQSQYLPASQNATRRELLRVALRDTLIKHGIPTAWIGAEMLTTSGRGREPGVHLRLLVKHWEPLLMMHGVALQRALGERVVMFDPTAVDWLSGISWQFALADDTICPAMPGPSAWTAKPSASHFEATQPASL